MNSLPHWAAFVLAVTSLAILLVFAIMFLRHRHLQNHPPHRRRADQDSPGARRKVWSAPERNAHRRRLREAKVRILRDE